MKKLVLIVITLMFSFILKSQDTLTYSKVSSASRLSDLKTGYDVYISKDSSIYSIGDTLNIGIPFRNGYFVYITEDNGMAMVALGGTNSYPKNLSGKYSNTNAIIKKMWIFGNKRSGFHIVFRVSGTTALSRFSIKVEDAISSGEIKSKVKYTSDEALVELKKAKDKLDLGILTQDQYEKIKLELSKYIK